MGIINFTIEGQQNSMWCWAAVTNSVNKFFPATSSNLTQCQLVRQVLNMPSCCGNPTPAACNVPKALSISLASTTNANGGAVLTVGYDQIEAELAAGKPVCVGIERPGGGSHFLVVSKCFKLLFKEYLRLEDPASGGYTHQNVKISKFKSTNGIPGLGRWVNTYFTTA